MKHILKYKHVELPEPRKLDQAHKTSDPRYYK